MSEKTKYSIGSNSIPDVHRSTDEFPAGQPCDLTVADVPSEIEKFSTEQHFDERRRTRQNPNVTDEVIEHLLTDSIVRRAPGNFENPRYLFQDEINDFEWTLVVADDGSESDPRYALITVYSNYHGSVGTTNRYYDRLKRRKE